MAVPPQGTLYVLPIKVLFRKRIPFTRIGVAAVFVPTQISLGALGGHQEITPDGEPTRVELCQRLARTDAAITAALAHRSARHTLNERARQAQSIPFDHPVWKAVGETEKRLDELLRSSKDTSHYRQMDPHAGIEYRNHRGEVAWRRIVPEYLWYGQTEWHPEAQWLLKAFDLDKNARRDFAMSDIREWSNSP